MSEVLKNPFKESLSADPNLSTLAEQGFLSKSDVAKLRELEGQKDRSSKFDVQSSLSDVSLKEGMSVEERIISQEIEHSRKDIIEWAKRNNLGDDEWVKENFEFDPDGSVICNADINLYHQTEPDLPRCIKEVNGNLWFGGTSATGLNLPQIIRGWLYLNNFTTAEDLILTDIKGPIFLNCIPRNEMQQLRQKYPNLKIE